MANETRKILIESILGGETRMSHFSQPDQFLNSIGIDPSYTITNHNTGTYPTTDLYRSSGLIAPVAVANIFNSTTAQPVLFIVPQPKNDTVYAYGNRGSVYTYNGNPINGDTTALSDGGALSNAVTCGAAYYDNYVYFAKNTTVARYGPLDGSPSLNGDYWVNTLGKAQLTDGTTLSGGSAYPNGFLSSDFYPQHVMHRHSDGKLYFADIVGNQGTIHYISTTKTTAEGDTDNGSTFGKLTFGYGLVPTAIESYGSDLVIALLEGPGGSSSSPQRGQRARIALWDTTSQNYNLITTDEFPDEFVSAMKNVNGVLYIASGNRYFGGFRVSRYVGGTTFEEVAYIPEGQPPKAGAMLGSAERLVFGSAAVYSLGLSNSAVSRGMFKFGVSANDSLGDVYALAFHGINSFSDQGIVASWYDVAGGTNPAGIDIINPNRNYSIGASYSLVPQHLASQIYRIGSPFKIRRVRIPLLSTLTSGVTLTAKIFVDNLSASTTIGTITLARYGTTTQLINLRPVNLTGDHSFFLQLEWSGTDQCIVSLPITIEYELLDIDTAFP